MRDFIEQFAFGGLVSFWVGSPKTPNAIYVPIDKLPDIPDDRDVFFGPAMRKTPGDEKGDVLGSIALWVDYDSQARPRWTLTPTYAVFSGHGWHCYWLLDVPCLDIETIETANKLLMADLDGDHCWNVNRVLRVPGTLNLKEADHPVKAELKHATGVRYTMEDIFVLQKLSKKTRHKIATGDKRGYRSRSERDWAIMTDLVACGASNDLIYKIFETQPCGDKHRDSGSTLYLGHSLERIREKPVVAEADVEQKEGTLQSGPQIVPGEDGYYVPYRKGALKRVSTFLLEPKLLLDGSAFETEDSLVCDVHHDSYVWPDVTFNREVFNSVSKMHKATPVAAWQWLGEDKDVRQLLPYLIEQLKQKGLPRVAATKTLGLHNVGGRWLFLGDRQTISKSDVWQGFEGPLAWIASKMENHPSLCLEPRDDDDLRSVGEWVQTLNEPNAIWPMIGWYAAASLKPWIEGQKYRFPVLNVTGTKGSGKSSLIQRVFMPLWGQTNPIAYDSGTTHFVSLMLLGCSNAVPISFSEFRVDAVQRFLRFVLLSYDTGHDARGRADQSTADYPLQAPFSLDGEDLIDDAAARERIVVARLHPDTIEEGSSAYTEFKRMQKAIPQVGGSLITRLLNLEDRWADILHDAEEEVFRAFPNKLPDRVRNNHIVTYFGMLLWGLITETSVPDASVLAGSIQSVFDIGAGRSRVLVDDMIEYIVNQANNQSARFKYTVQDGIFWFQLSPAYDDWLTFRRRQGRGALEKDAIKSQLLEAPYQASPQTVNGVWMYGINLQVAFENKLDVPSAMNWREIHISL